ncbi:hypothetical protein SNEBB_007812 [Seison nebaliae]|nr:hypothetical protein SNEBB_007812 [Seison nebaliae]
MDTSHHVRENDIKNVLTLHHFKVTHAPKISKIQFENDDGEKFVEEEKKMGKSKSEDTIQMITKEEGPQELVLMKRRVKKGYHRPQERQRHRHRYENERNHRTHKSHRRPTSSRRKQKLSEFDDDELMVLRGEANRRFEQHRHRNYQHKNRYNNKYEERGDGNNKSKNKFIIIGVSLVGVVIVIIILALFVIKYRLKNQSRYSYANNNTSANNNSNNVNNNANEFTQLIAPIPDIMKSGNELDDTSKRPTRPKHKSKFNKKSLGKLCCCCANHRSRSRSKNKQREYLLTDSNRINMDTSVGHEGLSSPFTMDTQNTTTNNSEELISGTAYKNEQHFLSKMIDKYNHLDNTMNELIENQIIRHPNDVEVMHNFSQNADAALSCKNEVKEVCKMKRKTNSDKLESYRKKTLKIKNDLNAMYDQLNITRSSNESSRSILSVDDVMLLLSVPLEEYSEKLKRLSQSACSHSTGTNTILSSNCLEENKCESETFVWDNIKSHPDSSVYEAFINDITEDSECSIDDATCSENTYSLSTNQNSFFTNTLSDSTIKDDFKLVRPLGEESWNFDNDNKDSSSLFQDDIDNLPFDVRASSDDIGLQVNGDLIGERPPSTTFQHNSRNNPDIVCEYIDNGIQTDQE